MADAGVAGAVGVEGVLGVEGSLGVEGVDGVLGVEGVDGVEGSLGVDGSLGVAGSLGVEGSLGVAGSLGVDASSGVEGVDGSEGCSAEGVEGADASLVELASRVDVPFTAVVFGCSAFAATALDGTVVPPSSTVVSFAPPAPPQPTAAQAASVTRSEWRRMQRVFIDDLVEGESDSAVRVCAVRRLVGQRPGHRAV